MKTTIKIYCKDMTAIVKNYAALIVIVALCILPSLYAWFNIKASWDPYSTDATKGIKIGVVNLDQGASLNNEDINIGNTIVEELGKNDQLGWQFVDKDTATKAVNNGTYYAMITIPQSFSSDLTSIVGSDIKKGEIIYTVNEKVNAIAPKLTDKGATSLQQMISKTVVETVSQAIFGVGNEIGINLEQEIPTISKIYNYMKEVQGHFTEINDSVDQTLTGVERMKTLVLDVQAELPNVKKTIDNAKSLTTSVQQFVDSTQAATEKLAPTIKNDLLIVSQISSQLNSQMTALQQAIQGNAENLPQILDQADAKVKSLNTMTTSILKVLEAMNKLSANAQMTTLIEQLKGINNQLMQVSTALNSVRDKVNNGEVNLAMPELEKALQVTASINNVTTSIYDSFDSMILPAFTDIVTKANQVASGASQILTTADGKLPAANSIANKADETADKALKAIKEVKSVLPEAEGIINDFLTKVGDINDEEALNNLVTLLKADVEQRSDFLANPVVLTEEKLFPMGNYGTSMTPFYTVLCLWVGILLLTSILTVEAHGEYRATQVYFAKLGTFLTVTLIQALIVTLGDLYLLKIYCSNPGLFILSNLLVALTFTVIVYSLVSVFGNVGKVVAIILLVLQVAGSGGTFPIQLTPKFFQVLNPFLPFTYGISLNREFIGGVVPEVVQKDLIVLGIFIVGFVLISVICKAPINKVMKKFTENFKKSGLGE